jgi:DnaJ-class molecular chaperone
VPTDSRPTPDQAPDPYTLLQVARGATPEQLTRAYRQRARELHPDLVPEDAAAGQRFSQLTEAYHQLYDTIRRSPRDADGPAGEPASPVVAQPVRRAEAAPSPFFLGGAGPLARGSHRRSALAAGPVHVEPLPPQDGGGSGR